VPWIEKCKFLNDEEKENILWRNAAGFLQLDPNLPFTFMKQGATLAS
jgi:hypothetical protein